MKYIALSILGITLVICGYSPFSPVYIMALLIVFGVEYIRAERSKSE